LSIKEAAEYLGRSVHALRELQWAGRLPYVQEGRRVLFDLLDLDAWIETHKRRETHRLD
jgi:excisionase family DNA binding protein